jgi:DtxR family Mn-dependent transcriptional regulator
MPGKPSSKLSTNLGDYLEAIYHLQNEKRVARAKDIADRLEVTRASVTGALKALSDKNLIHYEPYSFVTLTDQGEKLAADLIHRHQVLREFFEGILLMDEKTASANAYRGKHFVDKDATDRLTLFMEFMREEDHNGETCLEGFSGFLKSDKPKTPRRKKTKTG